MIFDNFSDFRKCVCLEQGWAFFVHFLSFPFLGPDFPFISFPPKCMFRGKEMKGKGRPRKENGRNAILTLGFEQRGKEMKGKFSNVCFEESK